MLSLGCDAHMTPRGRVHHRLLCSRCQALWGIVPRLLHHCHFRHGQLAVCVLTCSQLLALHRTATLRHDSLGQETLLNLLLRNHLAFNLYDQVLLVQSLSHWGCLFASGSACYMLRALLDPCMHFC